MSFASMAAPASRSSWTSSSFPDLAAIINKVHPYPCHCWSRNISYKLVSGQYDRPQCRTHTNETNKKRIHYSIHRGKHISVVRTTNISINKYGIRHIRCQLKGQRYKVGALRTACCSSRSAEVQEVVAIISFALLQSSDIIASKAFFDAIMFAKLQLRAIKSYTHSD